MDRLELLRTIGNFKQGRIDCDVVIAAVDAYTKAIIAKNSMLGGPQYDEEVEGAIYCKICCKWICALAFKASL
jgi:hypothetical protein